MFQTPEGALLEVWVGFHVAGFPEVIGGFVEPAASHWRPVLQALTAQRRWPIFFFDRHDGSYLAEQLRHPVRARDRRDDRS